MIEKQGVRVARYAAGGYMPAHQHERASLNLVLDGGFLERIRGAERRYASGHLAYCPAGEVHSQHFGARGARQLIVTLQADWIEYLRECRVNLAQAPYVRLAYAQVLGGRLLAELQNEDEFSPLACQGIVLEVLVAFARGQAGDSPRARPPAWLSGARNFIDEHACRPLRLGEIAQAAGRHEIHLAREFRRHFGVSIGAYQRRARIERAARLLAAPAADITSVALECGFASHSHLCRIFKAHFGVSPSRYRAARATQPVWPS
jgi:AraC family transcriptional regulator